MRGKTSPRAGDFSNLINLENAATAQNSYFDSKTQSMSMKQRAMTVSAAATTRQSTYGAMPTKNIKFEKFIELMFQSGMDSDNI